MWEIFVRKKFLLVLYVSQEEVLPDFSDWEAPYGESTSVTDWFVIFLLPFVEGFSNQGND